MATKYQILKQAPPATSDETPLYAEIGTAEGHTDENAISNFLEAGDNGEVYGEGAYRAVPARSWKPEPVIKKKKTSFV